METDKEMILIPSLWCVFKRSYFRIERSYCIKAESIELMGVQIRVFVIVSAKICPTVISGVITKESWYIYVIYITRGHVMPNAIDTPRMENNPSH